MLQIDDVYMHYDILVTENIKQIVSKVTSSTDPANKKHSANILRIFC